MKYRSGNARRRVKRACHQRHAADLERRSAVRRDRKQKIFTGGHGKKTTTGRGRQNSGWLGFAGWNLRMPQIHFPRFPQQWARQRH